MLFFCKAVDAEVRLTIGLTGVHLTCFCKVDGVFVVLFRGVALDEKLNFL